jgi:hypothetical protein
MIFAFVNRLKISTSVELGYELGLPYGTACYLPEET